MGRAVRGEAAPPLSHADIEELRARVGASPPPRVALRTASAGLPAGTRGPVVRIEDSAERSEFIVVRLRGDELPFAPGELTLPRRTARRPAAPETGGVSGNAPSSVPEPGEAPAGDLQAAPTPSRDLSAASTPVLSGRRTSRSTAVPTPTRPRARAATGSPRALPEVAVVLRFSAGGWTIEAQRGGKRVAKPQPIRASVARAVAELLDSSPVAEVVAETVQACRAVAAERAEGLRRQLAAAEAALAEFDEAGE